MVMLAMAVSGYPERAGVRQLHWDDFAPGSVADYGPRVITRDEIVAFAAEFDPQPMHLDEAAGAASILGGLAASGWHSCCLLMRMLSDGFISRAHFLGAPGVEEVKWLAPVRPGQALTARATVLETRPSRSREQIGWVTFRFELLDAGDGRLVVMTMNFMLGRRVAE
jgi:acyl dehydratase